MKPMPEVLEIITERMGAMVDDLGIENAEDLEMVMCAVIQATADSIAKHHGFPHTMKRFAEIAARIAPPGHRVELQEIDQRRRGKLDA